MSSSTEYEQLLITGYSNQLKMKILIPSDILNVITTFYGVFGLEIDRNLVHQINVTRNPKRLRLYNLFSNQCNEIEIENMFSTPDWLQIDEFNDWYSINSNVLPPNLRQIINDDNEDRINLNNNDWKLIIADHKYLIGIPDNRDKAYAFVLPYRFQANGILHSLYDETRNRLYAIGSYPWTTVNSILYGLNLNHSQGYNKWTSVGLSIHKIGIKTKNCGVCMVDNDRFIAMIDSQISELYALNCHESIRISAPNQSPSIYNKANCVYHNKYHRIIYGNNSGIQWYDINKDKWMLIMDKYQSQTLKMCNIWISNINKNLLFITCNDKESNQYIEVQRIDLRSRSLPKTVWKQDSNIKKGENVQITFV